MNYELRIMNKGKKKEKVSFILHTSYFISQSRRGFAMLFAVLVSSVLLSIGLSIFNLTVKELSLSSSGRESQFSFYSADSGAECALYWDFKGQDIFATSSSSRIPSPAAPDCAGTNINIAPYISDSVSAKTRFAFEILNFSPSGSPANYCVEVVVSKTFSGSIITTSIDSRGYNTGSASGNVCTSSDPNRVERALQIRY